LKRLDLTLNTLTAVAGTSGLFDADVSPDGTKLVAVKRFADVQGQRVSRLVTLPVAGGTQTTITPAPAVGGLVVEPRWTLDGSGVVYSAASVDAAGDIGWFKVRRVAANGSSDVVLLQSTFLDYGSPSYSTPDKVAPIAAIGLLPVATFSTAQTITWSGSDIGTGVAKYDVRFRVITSAGVSTTRGWLASTTLTSGALAVSPGNQYCVSVQAIDRAGNRSAWSAERCVLSPLDDRSLVRSGFTTGSSSLYYRSTVTFASRTTASLSRTGIKAKQVGLVVRTCATCGAVNVYLGGVKRGTLSTRGATKYRVVLWLPAGTPKSGSLVLKPSSSAPVYIDGVLIR
jgi:hypothetical protein